MTIHKRRWCFQHFLLSVKTANVSTFKRMAGILFAYGHLILQGKQLLRNQVLLPYYEATYKPPGVICISQATK